MKKYLEILNNRQLVGKWAKAAMTSVAMAAIMTMGICGNASAADPEEYKYEDLYAKNAVTNNDEKIGTIQYKLLRNKDGEIQYDKSGNPVYSRVIKLGNEISVANNGYNRVKCKS